MSDDQAPAPRASAATQDASNPLPEDFDGCARECRQAGAHTHVYGRCEHGVKPPPALSRFETFRADDGYLSGAYTAMNVEQVAEWLTEQGYTVAPHTTGPEGEVGDAAERAGAGHAELRERLTQVLTRVHYQRAADQVAASPEGHCAAFADAVMAEIAPDLDRLTVRYNAADAMARVGKIHQDRLHKVRAVHDRWMRNTIERQTLRVLDELGEALGRTELHRCPRCGKQTAPATAEICPPCDKALAAEVIAEWRERAERAEMDLAEMQHIATERSEACAVAEAAIARVRRLCDLTISSSIRMQAIDQAKDTLAALDPPESDHG